MRKGLLTVGLLIPLIFETGCGSALRGYTRDILEEGKDYFQTQIIPAVKTELTEQAKGLADKAKDAALAYVDTKLAEKEKGVLLRLDKMLEQIAEKDPDTGTPLNAKRALDFDDDRDGFLSPGEYGKAMVYVGKKAVSQGNWGMAGQAATGGAGGMAILAAAGFIRRRKRRPGDPPPAGAPAPAAPPPPA